MNSAGTTLYTNNAGVTEIDPTNMPAVFQFALQPTDLSVPGYYRETWDVLSADSSYRAHRVRSFKVAGNQGPVIPRWRLRHDIARLVEGDSNNFLLGVFTGGTGGVPADLNRSAEPDHHWRGAYIYTYAGRGRGQEVRVTDFTSVSGSFTIYPALNPAQDLTTHYELHRRFRPSDVNAAINQALDDLANPGPFQFLYDLSDETLTMTAATEYEIPAPFAAIREVWYQSPNTNPLRWVRLDRKHRAWDVVQGQRRLLRIPGPLVGARLRLIGQAPPERLDSDSGVLDLNPGFVQYQAAGHLCMRLAGGAQTDPRGFASRATAFYAMAKAYQSPRPPRAGSVVL